MTFSPDGVYLALSRSDNRVHLYDSRMIGKGVMLEYRHESARFIPQSQEVFGIVRAHWVITRSGQYRLLSGGEDGEFSNENVLLNWLIEISVLRLCTIVESNVVE